MKKAGIISIGNELLSGETVDTNASWLSRELLDIGMPTACVFAVGDDVSAIVRALRQAVEQADVIIVTGGLGPTDDDVTREALAEFLGVDLEFRQELFEQISAFFAGRNVPMADSNKVQAYVPVGARGLENRIGTAPGMFAEQGPKAIFCMPGVPREMEQMFTDSVLGVVEGFAAGQVVVTKKVMCFGVGESTIADKLGDLMGRDRNPLINSTAAVGVITLHVVATASDRAAGEEMVEADRRTLCSKLGDVVYGYDGQSLAEVVGGRLADCGRSVAVAESCTGGLVAKMITDVPGCSGYFTHGWVTYSDEAKISQLGVEEGLIEAHGAVSEEVACAMARGARQKAGADYAIGITGIAGPGGGTDEKPVGLVYISVDREEGCFCRRFVFSHSREYMRLRTAMTALSMVLHELD